MGINSWPTTEFQPPFVPNAEPLEILASLISQAQEKHGNIDPDEVLKLAAAAKDAIESLLSDMERAGRDALQEAALETLVATGNA